MNSIEIKKRKTNTLAKNEYKLANQLNSLDKEELISNNVVDFKSIEQTQEQYIYMFERNKTLRQYLNSEEYKKTNLTQRILKVQQICKSLLAAISMLSKYQSYLILTPQKIVISEQKVRVTVVSYEKENVSAYDPQTFGLTKQNCTMWSFLIVIDEILRGKLYYQQDDKYIPLEDTEDLMKLNQIFVKAFTNNQMPEIKTLFSIFEKPSRNELVCNFHNLKIVKVDMLEKKFYCEKCFKEEYYQIEVEKAECRKLMDDTINSYKKMNRKFDRIIRLTKGEESINTKALKTHVEILSKDFLKQYQEHVKSIILPNNNPLSDQIELDQILQNLEVYRQELVQKYQKKIKRRLLDEIKSQINNT